MTDHDKSDNRLRLVSKANDLVEAKYRLTVQEQKIILMAISKINPMESEFNNPYSLSIDEVAEACEINRGGTYQKVAAAVDKLMTRLVKLKTDDGHVVTHWIQKARYYTGQGHFEFWFDEDMKPYLLNLKEYISYDRKAVLQFQSQYSFRIYEILKKWQGANKGNQFSVKVEQIREVLGIRKTEYRLFADFKRRVIDKAKVELTQQSDLTFEYHTWKEGRAVVGLVFKIKDNVPTGKPKKVKRGRPKKNKSDQEIHLETNPPLEDFFDEGYSDNLTNTLHSKGIVHHEKYKNDGVKEEHWNQAIEEVSEDAKPGLVVSSAKKHRDLSKPKESKPDHSSDNREYWEEHQLEFSGLSYSTAYLQDKKGNIIIWADENFLDKIEKYRKSEDQRETNLFVETFKVLTAGGAQQKVINRINQKKQEGVYTDWDTSSNRVNGTNPEKVGAYFVGRASKENEDELKLIYTDVYGDGWEEKAKERLSKKGITF